VPARIRIEIVMPPHVRSARAPEHATLVEIWRHSVRATHTFLTERDIEALEPEAAAALGSGVLELWVLATDDDAPVGFMGLVDNDVSALFLDPDHRRQGGGRLLVDHARRLKGPLTVEVNEQNPEAVRFYEALGFKTTGRSPVDDAGRPFPILRMRQAGA
jgi:putative acetyltransferase